MNRHQHTGPAADVGTSHGWPLGASLAQIMVALGMMNLCPRIRGDHSVLTSRAGHTFEQLLDLAIKAGFPRKEKRLFVGGLRAGRPIPSVMARAERCVDLMGFAAFDAQLARHVAWEHFATTGSLPPGWTWREPTAAGGTNGATQ